MQDAGLYTHQRTLDIRFSSEPPKPTHSSNGNSNSSNSSSNSDILDGNWTEDDPYVEQKTQVTPLVLFFYIIILPPVALKLTITVCG